jgi:hypothetical protein
MLLCYTKVMNIMFSVLHQKLSFFECSALNFPKSVFTLACASFSGEELAHKENNDLNSKRYFPEL